MHGLRSLFTDFTSLHKKSQVFVFTIAFLTPYTTAIFILFHMIKSQTSFKIQNLCLTLSCIVSYKNMYTYISYMMVSFLWYSVGCYCDFIVIRRRLMILCRSRYPYFFSNMSEKPGPITRCFAYLILTGSIQFYNALIVQNSLNNIIQNILEEAVLKLQKHSNICH